MLSYSAWKTGTRILHVLRVCRCELGVGLHVLHRSHRGHCLHAMSERLIHALRIAAHYLYELIPLRLLYRRDLQLGMQVGDPLLDPVDHVVMQTRMVLGR